MISLRINLSAGHYGRMVDRYIQVAACDFNCVEYVRALFVTI